VCRIAPGVVRTGAVLGIAVVALAACGSTPYATVTPLPHSSHPPRPDSLSAATVCAAFNRAASPTMHLLSSYASFAKLAAQAGDVEIRSAAETLVRDSGDNPNFNVEVSKNFYDIGTVCVAKGLTPKYWAELA
jgi:hypothetical protein